jgi:hypothetical protein
MTRHINDVSKCEVDGCENEPEAIVYSRDLQKIVIACGYHADIVVDEQHPEYTDECRNCGCMQGVN